MKRNLAFIGVFVGFVLLIIVFAYFTNKQTNKNKPGGIQTTVVTPTLEFTQQPSTTPSPTQIPSSEFLRSDAWKVVGVMDAAMSHDGYIYDVAKFQNSTGEIVRAMCMNPGWPQPNVGDEYVLNEWGVFIPIVEDEKNPTQRFIDLERLDE